MISILLTFLFYVVNIHERIVVCRLRYQRKPPAVPYFCLLIFVYGMLFLPVMWKQIFDFVDGMCGYNPEDFFEPGGGLYAVHFAGAE